MLSQSHSNVPPQKRQANFHLPVPPYNPPANISPPLTPAYEHTDPFASFATPDLDAIWPEDESLSSLEKIYLFSRCKKKIHRSFFSLPSSTLLTPLFRSYVACHLVDYLEDVDHKKLLNMSYRC